MQGGKAVGPKALSRLQAFRSSLPAAPSTRTGTRVRRPGARAALRPSSRASSRWPWTAGLEAVLPAPRELPSVKPVHHVTGRGYPAGTQEGLLAEAKPFGAR